MFKNEWPLIELEQNVNKCENEDIEIEDSPLIELEQNVNINTATTNTNEPEAFNRTRIECK